MSKDNPSIIIYHSGNKMAYDQLSMVKLYTDQGINVIFFTPVQKGELHSYLSNNGIKYYGVDSKINNNFLKIIVDFFYMSYLVGKYSPRLVFSHLPLNNLIAGFVSFFFLRKRFIMVRHHTDYILKGGNKTAKVIDYLVNKIAPKIQVISDRSYSHLLMIEKVKLKKLMRLNLYFDFSLFPEPNMVEVNKIKEINKNKKIILAIGRLIPVKNHLFLLDVIKKIKKDTPFVLLILGEGDELDKLNQKIDRENLQNEVQLLGYKENVFDYIKAAELIVHLSKSENSSGVAKESAVLETAFLGFKSVGDSNVFLNKETGYPIAKNADEKKVAIEIEYALNDRKSAGKAENMKELMIKNYCNNELKKQYLSLIK